MENTECFLGACFGVILGDLKFHSKYPEFSDRFCLLDLCEISVIHPLEKNVLALPVRTLTNIVIPSQIFLSAVSSATRLFIPRWMLKRCANTVARCPFPHNLGVTAHTCLFDGY